MLAELRYYSRMAIGIAQTMRAPVPTNPEERIRARFERRDQTFLELAERVIFRKPDHPYAVISKDTPSLLPEKSIAVRFHSIGGWGMITTGKNLGELVGDFGQYISERAAERDEDGFLVEKLYVMANPKYGSEKKGAPTNYYLTVAPQRIQVNCELNHVDVVLCCDPKAFTHTNPLDGLKKGEIQALVAQNPVKMGYEGVKAVVAKIKGEKVEPNVDSGAALITKENVDSDDIQKLLGKK